MVIKHENHELFECFTFKTRISIFMSCFSPLDLFLVKYMVNKYYNVVFCEINIVIGNITTYAEGTILPTFL